MGACEAVGTSNPWKLGEAISEVAKGGTAHDRDQAEGGDGDACTHINSV